jgi:hypothetical protein
LLPNYTCEKEKKQDFLVFSKSGSSFNNNTESFPWLAPAEVRKVRKVSSFLEDLIKTCGYRLFTNVLDDILYIEEFAKQMFLYHTNKCKEH